MRWRVHGKASFFFSGAFPLPCLSFPIFDLFFYKSCFSAVVMRIESHGTDQLKACKPYQPLVSWRVVVAYRRGVSSWRTDFILEITFLKTWNSGMHITTYR